MLKSFDNLFDPYRLKVAFPELWADYLRRGFQHKGFRNPEAVAVFFDVTFQTACNWWNGTHRPSGDKVMIAAVLDDAFFAYFSASVAPLKRAA